MRRLTRWAPCPDCGREKVGVQPAWNTTVRSRYNDQSCYRLASHWAADRRPCTGSRMEIPASSIVGVTP